MKKRFARILIVTLMLLLILSYQIFDLQRFLNLNYLKQQHELFREFYTNHQLATLAVFFMTYVLTTALSLPGATILTLGAGALFGLLPAFVVVSFASTLGATLAFLAARFVLREAVERNFGDRLAAVNEGIKREGAFYLFTLRLVPVFPFFVINLLMGLTPMRASTFYFVSQLGMIPGTLVYVNAGTQLAQLNSPVDVLSPGLLFSFALLGFFPLLAKKVLDLVKERRSLALWKRPRTFDYNIVVIGAGSGGLVSAYIAAAVKAKVALIEKNEMGGDCLNTGCVPSKALIKTAKVLSLARRAKEFGLKSAQVDFEFADVMERVQRVIKTIAPHDSVERYRSLGVEVIQGEARLLSPYLVTVGDRQLTARNIIIATGASPIVPKIAGLEKISYYTSESIWSLRVQPKRLLVVGGGPIGCELSQAFRRLGSLVTLVDMADSILSREDQDVSELISSALKHEGITLLNKATAKRFDVVSGTRILVVDTSSGEQAIEFDEVLFALGRRARVQDFGLEELGVKLQAGGTIEHDDFLRTNIPNIYCVGDVAGPYQFTHTASHQAWYAAVNSLFSPFKMFRADYRVIPRVTFTDPEVATVGLTEREAKEKGIPYELTTYGLDDLDRAIAENDAHGFVKVLTMPGKDKILGATVVGAHAGESFIEFVAAMKHGFGLNKILGTIHPYPTFAESNKYAAGVWKKAHAPARILAYVKKFHEWRRS
jgi:pyruvate/2-oxoglutarate dehydrogenase complex dihydrolipoamide dehydrogenase (E3) component/uncharacterized membrane protein YdjX (TVP38/TMEM64 family)